MRTGINHLYIPGPTNVPEVVRQAMNVPMQDMRAHDFGALHIGLFSDLKRVFRTTTGTVLLFPGSGTGAWPCGSLAFRGRQNKPEGRWTLPRRWCQVRIAPAPMG